MTAVRIKRASNFTQRTMGSRCSPLAAERGVRPTKMLTAVLSFPTQDADHTEVLEAAGSLLAVWHKNGQIVGNDWPMTIADGVLRTYVRLPAADALDPSFANAYVLRDLDRLSACGAGRPV